MSSCKSCGAPIVWARVGREPGGKMMPIDPEPVPDGNVRFYDEGHVKIVVSDETWAPGEHRYRSHFASCPTANRHRRVKREGRE